MTKSTDRVLASLPLVDALARQLSSTLPPCVERDDLVQDGLLGLLDAASRFDETRGIRFDTFAHDRVLGAMVDGLRQHGGSRLTRQRRRQLDTARQYLRHVFAAEPTVVELAAHLGMAIDTVLRALAPPPVPVPDAPPTPDAIYGQAEAHVRLRRALAALPARERQIVRDYYFRDVPQQHLSATLGVTPARVSQLHTRALHRLRRVLQ